MQSILWCIEPLLGKDLETNNETTTVAMQWHDKHASTTIELLLETVFSTRSVQRGCKGKQLGQTNQLKVSLAIVI
jgi:hypothetical protein